VQDDLVPGSVGACEPYAARNYFVEAGRLVTEPEQCFAGFELAIDSFIAYGCGQPILDRHGAFLNRVAPA
jgi:hypothetical protein